jgi:ABC-type glycerol-3-phosphate transport system substrate-binding protein
MFDSLNLRPFQILLLGSFAFFAIIGLFLLQDFAPTDRNAENPYGDSVVVWGPFPFVAVDEVFDVIADTDEDFSVVQYEYVPPEEFSDRFVNAIAEGRNPDLVILPHTELVAQRSKLLPIGYDTDGFSLRQLRDTYVDGSELFALNDGVYGVPVLVDPLVLFWNRDLFSSAGFAGAPQTWEQIVGSVVGALTVRDNSRNILQSALAFGEYGNVTNASAVLSLLVMQSGSQLVTETNRGYEVGLNESIADGRPPLEAALQFYTDFGNASNPLYSWNRAQPNDRLAFLGGDLALYFGYGSEAAEILERNPNLNFDVALVPQGREATIRRTYGTLYSLAIPRATRNASGAFNAARTIANSQNSLNLALAVNHAPANRLALQAAVADPFVEVSFQSALFARGWLSPSPVVAEDAFRLMVEDVTSNRVRVSNAASDAVGRLTQGY